MAWTQADIDALKTAIGKGVKRVTFGDQTTEFHDVSEMITLLNRMEREVSSPRTHRLAVTSKGTGG